VADAYFSKRPFVEAVVSTGMDFINRLNMAKLPLKIYRSIVKNQSFQFDYLISFGKNLPEMGFTNSFPIPKTLRCWQRCQVYGFQ
jgi:hypothetical protein